MKTSQKLKDVESKPIGEDHVRKLNKHNVDAYTTSIPETLLLEIKNIIDNGIYGEYEEYRTSVNILCEYEVASFVVFKYSEHANNLIHRYTISVKTEPNNIEERVGKSDELKKFDELKVSSVKNGKIKEICDEAEIDFEYENERIKYFVQDFPHFLRIIIYKLLEFANFDIENILLIDNKSCEFHIRVTQEHAYKFTIRQIGNCEKSVPMQDSDNYIKEKKY